MIVLSIIRSQEGPGAVASIPFDRTPCEDPGDPRRTLALDDGRRGEVQRFLGRRIIFVQLNDRHLLLALDTLLEGGDIEPGIHPTPSALVDAGLAMEMGRKLRLTPLGLQVRLDLRAKAESDLQEDRYRRPVSSI